MEVLKFKPFGGYMRHLLLAFVCATLIAGCGERDQVTDPAQLNTLSSSLAFTALDIQNSQDAQLLGNGTEDPGDGASWKHATNRWSSDPSEWPMEAVLDFGSSTDISKIEVYVGQTPSADRSLQIFADDDNANWSDQPLTTVTPEAYGKFVPRDVSTTGRYLKLSFEDASQMFNISEVKVQGRGFATTGSCEGRALSVVPGVSKNSDNTSEARLLDGAAEPTEAYSWLHSGNRWDASKYPMSVTLDAGEGCAVETFSYYAGQGASDANSNVFITLGSDLSKARDWLGVDSGQDRYGEWTELTDLGAAERYVRLEFKTPSSSFFISEVKATFTDAGDSGDGENDGDEENNGENDQSGAHYSFGEQDPPEGKELSTGFGGDEQPDARGVSWYPRQPGDCSVEIHNRYWTLGPDDKVYHTWHHAVHDLGGAEECTFGHEHGDDPWESTFYERRESAEADGGYKHLWEAGVFPVPFGYAAEVQAENDGHRHEDHVGHKVYWEHFEAAYGNAANHNEVLIGSDISCNALLKIHQGSYSADAFSNHLHEMVTHFDCTDGAEVHLTQLSPMGRPGWFSNTCDVEAYGPTGPENNANSGTAPIRSDPVATRDSPNYITATLSANGPVGEQGSRHGPDGERRIPGAACVHTYSQPGSGYDGIYGHKMMEVWTAPVYLGYEGKDAFVKFRPYLAVLNPARVRALEYDGEGNPIPNSVKLAPTVSACLAEPENGMRRTSLCEDVLSRNLSFDDVESPFNGTVRNVNFKGLHVYNDGGERDYVTDAFGVVIEGGVHDPKRNIKQYVSTINTDNYRNPGGAEDGPGIAGSKPLVNASNYVCEGEGGTSCGGSGLEFALEWFRDYNNLEGVHAPN